MKNFIYSKYIDAFYISIISLSITLIITSCGPSINSFDVTPLVATDKDTVKINWDVNGDATLMIYSLDDDENEEDLSNENIYRLLEFKLVVKKGDKKEIRPIQVEILPKLSKREIGFPADLEGDTLIAQGEKNVERWNSHFKVIEVESQIGRELVVEHSNITGIITADGEPNKDFENTSVGGDWKIKCGITNLELNNPQQLPGVLKIEVKLKYVR